MSFVSAAAIFALSGRAGALSAGAAGAAAAGRSPGELTFPILSSPVNARKAIPAATITAPAAATTPPPLDEPATCPGAATWLQSAPTTPPAAVSVSDRIPASSATGSHMR
jgi:hypothetical protein